MQHLVFSNWSFHLLVWLGLGGVVLLLCFVEGFFFFSSIFFVWSPYRHSMLECHFFLWWAWKRFPGSNLNSKFHPSSNSKYIIIKYFSHFLWTLYIVSWERNMQSKSRVCYWICSKAKQNNYSFKRYMECHQIESAKLPNSCSPFQKHVQQD